MGFQKLLFFFRSVRRVGRSCSGNMVVLVGGVVGGEMGGGIAVGVGIRVGERVRLEWE